MVKEFAFKLMNHVNLVILQVIQLILNLTVLHALLDSCKFLENVLHFHLAAKVQLQKTVEKDCVLVLKENVCQDTNPVMNQIQILTVKFVIMDTQRFWANV